ncbi:MAG: segregation/condensation protein A [Candidatus Marinimicrobia bacterium]|nr:segregation/condensation protein A [Candidatus Neomarinimicrobiota bacterium]
MDYRIKLQNFEGPLDLLLFFISRDKLNIYDIPIHKITNEFLKYIEMMKLLKIEVAGEFILMASILMRIKSKMLLPKPELEDDEDIEDPRLDLVQQLLEYKRFKKAGHELEKSQEIHNLSFSKGINEKIKHQEESLDEVMRNVTLVDLLSMFDKLMRDLPEQNIYELNAEEYNISTELEVIRSQFMNIKKLPFLHLFQNIVTKLKVVVTFMAILEMIQNKELNILQEKVFGEIQLEVLAS